MRGQKVTMRLWK